MSEITRLALALKPSGLRRRLAPTTTSAPAATPPTAAAATGRTQLRGSRKDWSSESESSSAQVPSAAAACSVIAARVVSTRLARSSGGSIGRSASARSASRSMRPGSLISRLPSLGIHQLLELLERAVDEHLGRAVRLAQRARDLAVVHAQGEAHDQGLPALVRQPFELSHQQAELLPALDHPLRRVRMGRRLDGLDVRCRPTRAVAVEIRREVVGDADEPRAHGPAGGLAARAVEVPVRL